MKNIAVAAIALCAVPAALCDSLDNIGEVRLKGPLGDCLDRMVANHVAGTDPDYITAPFMEKTETKGWWQTEFWGKWMHSAVPYLRYVGNGEPSSPRLRRSRRGTGNGRNAPSTRRRGSATT